jgi:tRNA G18 (ribose-2'-O)-methylase SpoU
MNKQEVEFLSEEVEMLMQERAMLLNVAGAAAVLISHVTVKNLSPEVVASAEKLSEALNVLREETLQDALDTLHGEVK